MPDSRPIEQASVVSFNKVLDLFQDKIIKWIISRDRSSGMMVAGLGLASPLCNFPFEALSANQFEGNEIPGWSRINGEKIDLPTS